MTLFRRVKKTHQESQETPPLSIISQEDLSFAPPVSASLLGHPHPSEKQMVFSILIFFAVFCLWASLFKIDEVTRCEGKIISPGRVQMIDNLEGGIIKEILVREGQTVYPDQVLIRIKNVGLSSELEETNQHYLRKKAISERLRAEIEEKDFIPSHDLEEKAPSIVNEEKTLYKIRHSQYQEQEEILRLQVDQRKNEREDLITKEQTVQELYRLAQEELKILTPLLSQKLIPLTEFLKQKRDVSDLMGQLKSLRTLILKSQASIHEAEERLREAKSQRLSQISTELRNALGDLSELEHVRTARHDRVYRSEVRSPVYGIVQNMKIHTLGGVIKPGQNLLEIVPIEESLLIEARVSPSDIAFVIPGLKARVKLSAYDYSIYGGLEAQVTHVSADTLTDDKGMSYYKIELKTDKNHLVHQGKKLSLMPGMTSSIDILTQKKTIMQYILKPFFKIHQNALRER